MEILKEILRIVTSKSDVSKQLPELVEDADPELADSITGQFLRGLISDEWNTDEEAALSLYGSERSDQRYRTLKSRTYERLLHSLLFLQVKQPVHSEYLSYYYKCTRNLICTQTLMRFASRTAGFAVAQKTLTMAQRYQFTDICLTLSALMRESVAVWGQRKKFDYYNELVNNYFRTLEAEYRSDALLDQFGLEASATIRTKQYLIHYGDTILSELTELADKFQSHMLKLNLYRHRIVLANFKDDTYEIIASCDEAINYLTQNPHLSQPARLGEFRLRKMVMLVLVRNSQEATSVAESVVNSFREAGTNWYTALFFATAASFQGEKYEDAERYLEMATGHRKYPLIDEATRETYTVFSAYLYLAERLGLYHPKNVKSKNRQFRLSTFLNSVPAEAKDKKVVNVLILISHVLFLIVDGDLESAERRIEYLKVYGSRYLKEKHFTRVRVFIKMLQTMPRMGFVAKDIRIANEDLYEQLLITSQDRMPPIVNEYIPFEVLYRATVDYLESAEKSAGRRVA